jgi:hypothetical protein
VSLREPIAVASALPLASSTAWQEVQLAGALEKLDVVITGAGDAELQLYVDEVNEWKPTDTPIPLRQKRGFYSFSGLAALLGYVSAIRVRGVTSIDLIAWINNEAPESVPATSS